MTERVKMFNQLNRYMPQMMHHIKPGQSTSHSLSE